MPKVYFVEAVGLGLIKIGTASDVGRRISELQMASPAKLILHAAIRGDLETEREHHVRFEAYRHHGEWFVFSGELLEYVNGLIANPEPPEHSVSIKDWNGLVWRTTPTQFFRWMEFLFGPEFLDAHAALGLSKPQLRKWWDDAQVGRCSIPENALRKLMSIHMERILRLKIEALGPIRISYVNDRRRDYVLNRVDTA